MLSYAGVPLLQTDKDGVFQAFIDNLQRLEDSPLFGAAPVSVASPNNITRSDVASGVGFPMPNWPAAPKPRLNVLTWPETGASRWATFYGVTNDPNILNVTGPNYLLQGSESVIATQMFPLPIRRVTSVAEPTWLVVLVDARYFWQQTTIGALSLSSSSTWSNLYSICGSAIGVSITVETINVDYLNPDWIELNREFQSIPVLLDAIASSVGQRIVCLRDGSVYATNATTEAPFTTNDVSDYNYVAGGSQSNLANAVAANVIVTFPKYADKHRYCDGDIHAISTATGVGEGEISIHSSCCADFTNEDSDPDNLAYVQSLAEAITADYAEWRTVAYDITFADLVEWESTGYGDRVEYYYGTQVDGKQLAYTRIVSLPYDFGFESQLSQHNQLTFLDDIQVGRLGGTIAKGSHGSVNLYDLDGSSLGISVEGYDWLENANEDTEQYDSGTKVFVFWVCHSNHWAFLPSGGTGDSSDKQAIVKVTAGTPGEYVQSNGSCLWAGKLITFGEEITSVCSDPYEEGEDIWLTAIDGVGGLLGDGSEDTVATPSLISGDRFFARKIGVIEYAEQERDLYALRSNMPASARFIRFQLYSTLSTADASAPTCPVADWWNGPEPNSPLTVYNLPKSGGYVFEGQTNDYGYAVFNERDSKYYIFAMKQSGGSDQGAVVQVTDGSTGEMVGPNGNCVWGGSFISPADSFATLCDSSTFQADESVWIFAIDKPGGSAGVGPQVKSGERFIGRKWGTFSYGGDVRDLYAIRSDYLESARTIKFKLATKMTVSDADSTDAVVLEYWDGPDPGPLVDVHNLLTELAGRYLFKGLADAVGYATYDDLEEKYKITSLEPPALWIQGTLTHALNTGSATGNISGYWQGQKPSSGLIPLTENPTTFYIKAASGANYRAIYNDVADKYYIDWCETVAQFVEGTIYNTFNTSDAVASGSVEDSWGLHGATMDPGSVIEIDNTNAFWEGGTGRRFQATRDVAANKWRFTWISCV